MNINYFDNAWHVFSAFAVFIAGLLVFGSRPFRSVSTTLSLRLYCFHSFFCLYYARFALYNTADAAGYYRRSLSPDVAPGIGTRGVDFFTSIFTQFLGLSYLGAFLVFNIIGALGVLATLAAIRETTTEKTAKVRLIATLICFAPGINFWTAAIGKDAISMLGTGLICWATLNIRKRWLWFPVGAACYLLVRPQVVPIIFIALSFSLLISGRMSIVKKVAIALVLAGPTLFAVQLALSVIGLGDSPQFDGVNDFIEYRQSVNVHGGSSIDLTSMSLPMQMFYYAFMPLFIGAGGLLGLVASIENAFLMMIVVMSIPGLMRRSSSLPPQVKWFYLSFALVLWVIFAMTTANTGLALRQKWMLLPTLLLYCLSYMPARQHR
tara:strand:+ start:19975 stop:21111 length:1137 start_codon:yes stop_codon:yes gene_type:complete